MALTEEQIAHFYREGFVVVPGLVPAPALAAVRLATAGRAKPGERWQPTIFDHRQPEKDTGVHQLLWEPAVSDAASAILGSPARIYYGMLAIVPANGGHGLPWHQDNQYSTILGGALNIFIALGPITEASAGLWVAPRSHLGGVLPAKANETTAPGHREAIQTPENGLALPPMVAGDACIFDRFTLHRSGQNLTADPRFAYAAQYQSEHAREAKTGNRDPLRMRADELRTRLAAAGAPT